MSVIKSLTVAEVKGAKGNGKPYSMYDNSGLVLNVSAVGGKSWVYRYTHPVTRKRQTYTIGRYPDFTLSEARERRDELKRQRARGIDPCEEKKRMREEVMKRYAQTFGHIVESWLAFKKSGNLRPKTIENIERIANSQAVPLFGKIAIHDIDAPMVISALKKYSDRNNTLHRLISTLNEIMNFAVNSGVIKNNPLLKIKSVFNVEGVKSHPALPIDELPMFIRWWESESSEFYKPSLLFLMLTMVRPKEAFEAEWSEFNLDSGVWTIPQERIKTKCEHVVPLSSQAIGILKDMQKIKHGKYVFPSRVAGKPLPRRSISGLISDGPYSGRVTPHGFRAMWSTLLNEEGFNPDVIEAALAHKSDNAIRNIYNRTKYFEQRRIMMQWVGDFMDSARNGIINRQNGRKGLKLVNE